VLQEVVRAAMANRALPTEGAKNGAQTQRSGDALTDFYVRQAARAADALPDDVGPRAFLVALGVGLDHSDMLLKIPGTGTLPRAVENAGERRMRLMVLGEPTMKERRDLAQHFFVSGYLVAALGKPTAEAAGVAKELIDSHGTSGFSFVDIAADRAGVRFAEGVLNRRLSLNLLAQGFTVAAFMPQIEGLPEGLKAVDFAAQFGTADDERFRKQLQEIDQRLQKLPPYRLQTVRLQP
jgi:hypothetical protein